MSDQETKKPKGKEQDKAKGKGKGKGEAAVKETVKAQQLPKGPSPYELKYTNECIPRLMEQFKYTNRMRVPRLQKVVINTCLKDALTDAKVLEIAAQELADISGQRPVLTRARKSIANFKLRAGVKIGAMVTLRGKRMYEFFNRLVNIALPRVRDFKGVSPKAFDGRGNYTLGLTEQIMFPEINFDKVNKVYGMNISFVTTAKTDEEGRALLAMMGMPFKA